MNKAFTLSLVILLVTATATETLYQTQYMFPRHIDPREAAEHGPDPGLLTLLIEAHVSGLRSLDINTSLATLRDIERVYVPERLREVFKRFTELSREFLDTVNTTDSYLDTAEVFLRQSDFEKASEALVSARTSLSRAVLVLGFLEDAVSRLGLLGIPFSAIARLNTTYHDTLKTLLERTEALERAVEEGRRGSIETYIDIIVWPERVWFGERVYIEGVLRDSNATPLPGRVVVVHIGPRVTEAVTDDKGVYRVSVSIDFYSEKVPVYSEYIPSGRDVGLYRYSRSSEVYVEVLYIRPRLSLYLDRDSYTPGSVMRVSLYSDTSVDVYIDLGFEKSRESVSPERPLEKTYRIPVNISEGVYTVAVYSIPSGVVGPSSTKAVYRVYRLSPSIWVEAPDTVFTGIPARVYIGSNVSGVAEYRCLDTLLTIPVEKGSLSEAPLYIPPTYLYQNTSIEIVFRPLDPAYREVVVVREVRVFSTPVVSLTAALASYIVARVLRDILRTRRPGETVVERAPQPLVERPLEVSREVSVSTERVSTRIFYEVLRILEKATGLVIMGHETLREYYKRVSEKIGRLGEVLRDFFMVYERIVYGREGETPLLVDRLRRLYSVVAGLFKT